MCLPTVERRKLKTTHHLQQQGKSLANSGVSTSRLTIPRLHAARARKTEIATRSRNACAPQLIRWPGRPPRWSSCQATMRDELAGAAMGRGLGERTVVLLHEGDRGLGPAAESGDNDLHTTANARRGSSRATTHRMDTACSCTEACKHVVQDSNAIARTQAPT